jgi:glycerate 2-kinase
MHAAAPLSAPPFDPIATLRSLFDAALIAVDPMHCVTLHLPPKPNGRIWVLGAGKASARMARAVEAAWDVPMQGLVVTRYGHSEDCNRIEIVQAAHPVPDEAGQKAALRMLALAQQADSNDLVLALMSGGGSSLITLPAPGLTMEDLQAVNQALLHSGAPIGEMNTVRRHLSAIKGGRLAQACGVAHVHTLVISDVPGDDPAIVASGPTIADHTTPADALTILRRYAIKVLPHVLNILQRPPSPATDASQGLRSVQVIATADTALKAAYAKATALGLKVINLGGAIEGESREVAREQAMRALALRRNLPAGQAVVILSGGETTVTVRGAGRGGRNSEFLLALAIALQGAHGVYALACDTDGIDGVEDNAGGIISPDSLLRAQRLGLNTAALLNDNNAYAFLHTLGDTITTGPTRTNVNDFRAVLITSAHSG